MKLLAIDTSTEACSAALMIGDEVIFEYDLAPRKQAELILPMIDQILGKAELKVTQLDGLAFGRGPGAFTGLRIATGVMQGMAFAADLPVVAISSLAAMAQGAWSNHQYERVITAIDARMNEVYWSAFTLQKEEMVSCLDEVVCPPDSAPKPEGKDWVVVGSGSSAYEEKISTRLSDQIITLQPDCYPHAKDILSLAKRQYLQGGSVLSADQLSPVYIRDNVVAR